MAKPEATLTRETMRDFFKNSVGFFDGFSNPRKLATVYFFCSLIIVSCLALIVPPFHNSDEFAHFHRVDQISHGGLIVHRTGTPPSAGGVVNTGPLRLTTLYDAIRFHSELKVTPEMTEQTAAISMGDRRYIPFSNSAVYSPLLYIPCVGGFLTSRLLHLNAAHTLHLTRLFNGIVCVGLAALAIALAGWAAPFLAAVLSLPMTWSLFAAVSQDGMIMVAAAFGACLFTGCARMLLRPGTNPTLIGSATALGVLALGRPAYLPLIALPFFAIPLKNWKHAAKACGIAFGVVMLWCVLVRSITIVSLWDHASPPAQLSGLLHHPTMIWTLVLAAFGPHQGMTGFPFWQEMIGLLGWIDTPMPHWFYLLSAAMTGVLLLSIRPDETLWAPWKRLTTAVLLGTSITLIFFLEYLTFTPVGQPFVVGVQGRYFLPLLPFLPLLISKQPALIPEKLSKHLNATVPFFVVLSGIVCLYSVFVRYYIQGTV